MSEELDRPTPGDNHKEGLSVDDEFVVVGVGASAGGIKALRDFFAAVPSDSGMAYVVILHLSPDHDSKLAEVLQAVAKIPVSQVTEAVGIEPNHVYVIPPNQSLSIRDNTLVLSDVTGFEERRAPVDIFFRTLAESRHDRAVAVVLSGTGANGSMGLKRVKERGGIAITQDPNEAEYTDMPGNSIATGLVDLVLPAADIPSRLVAYAKSRGQVRASVEAADDSMTSDQALRAIFVQLRAHTGHDFTQYKRATVQRRIARRINVRELPDLQAYARYLAAHPEEASALLRDLLISVTNFFRDSEAFDALATTVVPRLFDGKRSGDQVRVWVAGCATGEEAYSIAMLLAEHASTLVDSPDVQVFATDIDERAIAAAREGFYTPNDAADVSPDRLSRFFIKEQSGYRVRRELRETVLFADHNLIKDPPFSHLDLVSCRNLLIYLGRSAQERVSEALHFALRPGGYLFLGASETVNGAGDRFSTVDKAHRIYQSRAGAARVALPVTDLSPVDRVTERSKPDRGSDGSMRERSTPLELHRRLLEAYGPPSALVDEEYDILHLSERAGRYLHLSAGEPTRNLLKLVRPELRLDLRTALFQAVQTQMSVEARGVQVLIDGRARQINIVVRPSLREGDSSHGLILVLFEETDEILDAAPTPVDRTAGHLEEELSRTRAQLRATVEQYELQHEDLRASNEELQAINEELRSAAEELETSKEELQSVNEELTTVNQELKINIDELGHTNDDFRNLINSTDIGTIFLDRSLRIQLSTPRARDLFNLIPTDIGRPLLDLTNKLVGDELATDIERVLETLHTVEREVEARNGRWYVLRVLPYRTIEDHIDGVVITFVDITERKLAELALRERDDQLALTLRATGAGLWGLDLETGAAISSEGWSDLMGGSNGAGPGPFSGLRSLVHLEDRPRFESALEQGLRGDGDLEIEFRITHPERGLLWLLARARLLPALAGSGPRLQGILVDITERKRAEEQWQASEERLRLLVESAKDFAIFTFARDGRVDSWSAGAERVFGYSEDEILGRSIDILFTPEDRERRQPAAEMHAAEAEGSASDERWHIRKSGELFYASGVVRPLLGDPARGFVKIARDLTMQQRAQEELQRTHDELEVRVEERTRELHEANEVLRVEVSERSAAQEQTRRLLRQIVTVQEDERQRISRDLHDQLGQQLTALRLKLELLGEGVAQDAELSRQVEATKVLAKSLDDEVDFLAWELRPSALDELGLVTALENYVREWSEHFGVAAEFHTAGLEGERLDPNLEIQLYRITQEALNNVSKHAAARQVTVMLEQRDGDVALIIEDDGQGFDPGVAAKHGAERLGLGGMRERATLVGGTLQIEAEPNQGTTVFVRVALTPSADGTGSQ